MTITQTYGKSIEKVLLLNTVLTLLPQFKRENLLLKNIYTQLFVILEKKIGCYSWRNPNTPALVKIRTLSVDHRYNTQIKQAVVVDIRVGTREWCLEV
jgi:hypothetical protein